MNYFVNVLDKISKPMKRFGELKAIKAIQEGLVGSVGITIIGAIFLLLYVLSAPDYLAEGVTVLPFLSDICDKFLIINALTMNMLALYVSVSIAIAFGKEYDIEPITSALSGLMAFILLSNNGTQTAVLMSELTDQSNSFTALDATYYNGGGLIVAIIAGFVSIYIIHLCYKWNVRIKMPSSVPDAVENSFSALIPYFITAVICWGIRSILNFDISQWFTTALLPILGAADNCFTYTLFNFIKTCLWSVGLNGDNMLSAICTPLNTIWLNENVAAATAGETLSHVWIANIGRLDMWVSSVWPILFLLLTSKKLKHMKPFAIACTPAAIFGIVVMACQLF
ncbi:MAG: PTS transporter subunit EIIC [Erysipelotrichaceae bacterium]|nr:PTS transporter subunit EIIC [Erysipelotrichaceae bacterium]